MGARWGLCLGPTGLEKALGAVGVGLRLKEQKGPRSVPHPGSQSMGDLTWEPSRLPGLEWVGQMPSSPLLLPWSRRAPPACLSYSPLSLLPMTPGPMWPEWGWGALQGRGLAWELSSLPGPECARRSSSAPLLLLPESPSRLPLLISPASGAPILSVF